MKYKNINYYHSSIFSIHNSNKAFTLIELLVVISIIGIITFLAVSRFTVAEKQTRDSERKSDLNQYRIALENFANANDLAYPILACANVSSLCALDNFQTTYLSGECINDPRVGGTDETLFYTYCSDTAGLNYVLWGPLESGGYFEVCSNGRSGIITDEPDGSDGTCTLPDSSSPTAIPTPT